jgi:hypothetical protein
VTARRELIARLGAAPAQLDEVARRAEHYGPAGEGWPAWKVVLHLLVVEEDVWQVRLREMSEIENPSWTWTEPDLDGREVGRSLADLLGAFAAQRRGTVERLVNLDDAGWRRVGTHSVFGGLDVAGLVREALSHDAEHLTELERQSTA